MDHSSIEYTDDTWQPNHALTVVPTESGNRADLREQLITSFGFFFVKQTEAVALLVTWWI